MIVNDDSSSKVNSSFAGGDGIFDDESDSEDNLDNHDESVDKTIINSLNDELRRWTINYLV